MTVVITLLLIIMSLNALALYACCVAAGRYDHENHM